MVIACIESSLIKHRKSGAQMTLVEPIHKRPAAKYRAEIDRATKAGRHESDQAQLLDWAFRSLNEAQQRVAELEARVTQLEGLTVTDELTRVLNRRGFLMELDRALEGTRRGGPAGALIICDLDGFKAVNDRHGHNAGNCVLRDMAAALARRVRRTDAVARLGGDEFAFLLIGANLATAARKTQSLERMISGMRFAVEGAQVTLSASFGYTEYNGSETQEELLHRADMAMYEQKRCHGHQLTGTGTR